MRAPTQCTSPTEVTFDHIALEEFNRGMLEPVAAHRDIRQRYWEMLDLLRRVAFDPVLGCIPVGQTSDPMVSEELCKMYYTSVAPDPLGNEVKKEEADVDMAPTDPTAEAPAGEHQGDSPAGPKRVEMVPEEDQKTERRWNGFKTFVGNIWLTGEEKSKALSPDAGIAVGERQGDLPTATTAEEAVPHRGSMWAFGEEFLPQSEQKNNPSPSAKLLMACLREQMEVKAAAQEEVPTPPAGPQEGGEVWDRKAHPLFYKFGRLHTLVSFPDEDFDDEYPGAYIKPDLKHTHFQGIDSLKEGRLFKITNKRGAFYRPPGTYDEVFGVGTEYEIDEVRCGIVWDSDTWTHALMLAARFYPRHPSWSSTTIWAKLGMMELQQNKWGSPGKYIYFADLRGDSECEDGKIPEPQIYSDLQQIWIQRRQNVVEFPTHLGRIHCGS